GSTRPFFRAGKARPRWRIRPRQEAHSPSARTWGPGARGLWGPGARGLGVGSGLGQSIRVGAAARELLVFRLRGVSALGAVTVTNPDFDPVLLGGLQLFGGSSIVSDAFRVYGGGHRLPHGLDSKLRIE